MYRQCGYTRVMDDDTASSFPMYQDFTHKLNLHDGATRGRKHFLLAKHVQTPTWLNNNEQAPYDDDDEMNDDTKRWMETTEQRRSRLLLDCKVAAEAPTRSMGFDIPV